MNRKDITKKTLLLNIFERKFIYARREEEKVQMLKTAGDVHLRVWLVEKLELSLSYLLFIF